MQESDKSLSKRTYYTDVFTKKKEFFLKKMESKAGGHRPDRPSCYNGNSDMRKDEQTDNTNCRGLFITLFIHLENL